MNKLMHLLGGASWPSGWTFFRYRTTTGAVLETETFVDEHDAYNDIIDNLPTHEGEEVVLNSVMWADAEDQSAERKEKTK